MVVMVSPVGVIGVGSYAVLCVVSVSCSASLYPQMSVAMFTQKSVASDKLSTSMRSSWP